MEIWIRCYEIIIKYDRIGRDNMSIIIETEYCNMIINNIRYNSIMK